MRLSTEFREALDQSVKWQLTNVPELDNIVLIVFDYSPGNDHPPISIAFDCSGGAKCWMSRPKVKSINGNAPNPYSDPQLQKVYSRKSPILSILNFGISSVDF